MKLYAMIAAVGGILVAALVFLLSAFTGMSPIPLEYSFLVGAMFALTLFPVLIWSEKRREQRYHTLEEGISSPIFCKANGNFNLGIGVRNGSIYFCKDGVLIALLDEKPTVLEALPTDQIESFQFEAVRMVIHTVDDRCYLFTSRSVPSIRQALITQGWILVRDTA